MSNATDSNESFSQQVMVSNIAITPNEHDVLFSARGEVVERFHAGTTHFRSLVDKHRASFDSSTIQQKMVLIQQIVREIKEGDPPGRFITEESVQSGLIWREISIADACTKTNAAFASTTTKLVTTTSLTEGNTSEHGRLLHFVDQPEPARVAIVPEKFPGGGHYNTACA